MACLGATKADKPEVVVGSALKVYRTRFAGAAWSAIREFREFRGSERQGLGNIAGFDVWGEEGEEGSGRSLEESRDCTKRARADKSC